MNSEYPGRAHRPSVGFNPADRLSDISTYGRITDSAIRAMEPPRHFDPHGPAPIHRGKGPKSYRKSDERIFDDICRRMADNRYLDASDIEVKVNGGEVVMTGTVSSRYEKRLAEDLGDTTYGVRNVENRLRINDDR